MEDLIGIVVMIIYLFAAFSGKKKKAQKKTETLKKGFERAFTAEVRAKGRMPSRREVQPEAVQEPLDINEETLCEERRVHLHEVTQEQMHMAQEGEDPCHAGGAPDAETQDYADNEQAAGTELTQDVLRGVIMSEILTRPRDRAALKRNRRSAG